MPTIDLTKLIICVNKTGQNKLSSMPTIDLTKLIICVNKTGQNKLSSMPTFLHRHII